MTVPGGASLACGGVTRVTVASTHRRRGLLRAMMRRQLDDMHQRGEPLAGLLASEAAIYGRFGYGLATYQADLEIDRAYADFVGPAAGGRISMLDAPDAVRSFSRVWERARKRQPAMLRLDEPHWREQLSDIESRRGGYSPHYRVLYEADGEPQGFATYRIKMDWDTGPRGELRIDALITTSSQAYAALWRYLLNVDLISKVRAWMRPPEEPIRFLLSDSRQPKTTIEDGIWLRLVDVPAALERRRYASEGRLVLAIRDEFCPWNDGVFEVEGGPEGARCRKSDSPPDIEIGAGDLASIYLGGNRVHILQDAGRLTEKRAGAVARAEAMFAVERAPWCPTHF